MIILQFLPIACHILQSDFGAKMVIIGCYFPVAIGFIEEWETLFTAWVTDCHLPPYAPSLFPFDLPAHVV